MVLLVDFVKDIIKKRAVVYELAKRDFKQQYLGSYLGFVWVFLQPVMYICILYFVFTFGLKAGGVDAMPFSLFIISGILVWQYFSEVLLSSLSTIKAHSYLVKKVDFNLSLLPMVKIMSSAIPHLVLTVVALILATYNSLSLTIYSVQLVYYFFSLVVLLLGLSWLISSMSVFAKDVSKFVALILQFGFWVTPIFWDSSRLPNEYRWVVNINPLSYVIEGYRDSIASRAWFWEKGFESFLFWMFTAIVLFIGMFLFRRLRPHFAEVI